MKRFTNFSVKDALSFVRIKRSVANPNKGFINQLEKYEDKLKLERIANDSIRSTINLRKNSDVDEAKSSIKCLLTQSSNKNHLPTMTYRPQETQGSSTPFLDREKQKLYSKLSNTSLFGSGIESALKKSSSRTIFTKREVDSSQGRGNMSSHSTNTPPFPNEMNLHPSTHRKQYAIKSSRFR